MPAHSTTPIVNADTGLRGAALYAGGVKIHLGCKNYRRKIETAQTKYGPGSDRRFTQHAGQLVLADRLHQMLVDAGFARLLTVNVPAVTGHRDDAQRNTLR